MTKGKIVFFIMIFMHIGWGVQCFSATADPTMPAVGPNTSTPETNASMYQLTEIIISYDRRLAVINGEYKKEGDEILGNRIVAISKNTVQLQGPSGKITLFLLGKPVKHVSVKEGV